MITCDRCGKKIKYPVIIRYTKSVGIMATIFNVRMDDYNLCPKCTESFKNWLWCKKIKDN